MSNFQQGTAQGRAASGRFPNGSKVGSGSGWPSYGGAGAPGLSNPQRSENVEPSWSQTIIGSQPASTPLNDPSQFPSLSGAPQSQSQTSGNTTWAARANQQSQSQADQLASRNPTQSSTATRQSGLGRDDLFQSSAAHAAFSGDEFGGQSRQPQPGSFADFPPLGDRASALAGRDLSGENESERPSNLLQNDGFQPTGFNNPILSSMSRRQNQLSGSMANSSQEASRITSPSVQGQGPLSASRSPNSQGQNGTIGQDRPGADTSGIPPGLDGQRALRQNDYSRPSLQDPLPRSLQSDPFAGRSDLVDQQVNPNQAQQQTQSLEQELSSMSERDRWGMRGFLTSLMDPTARTLIQGHDLDTLGLNFRSSSPLSRTFMGPFANPNHPPPRPLTDEYNLPACYTIANVVPLDQRINSFTDETLFYIFYTRPRDIMQEMVAEELIGRKWRFHIPLKQWITRDESVAAPVEVEKYVSESGYYWFWNYQRWGRDRRQFLLRYEDLDKHLTQQDQSQTPVGGPTSAVGANAAALANFNAVPALERQAAGMGGRGF